MTFTDIDSDALKALEAALGGTMDARMPGPRFREGDRVQFSDGTTGTVMIVIRTRKRLWVSYAGEARLRNYTLRADGRWTRWRKRVGDDDVILPLGRPGMMWLACLWLACAAVFIEAALRAPVIDGE